MERQSRRKTYGSSGSRLIPHLGKIKVFFFEKKKQKTFMSLDTRWRNLRDS
jgi:hypothetical protein